MKYKATEFYPTPTSLLEKALAGVKWSKIHTILEPSAGKGDIIKYIKGCPYVSLYKHDLDIDCIEIDPELRATLKGFNYRVVHDDFLTYHSFKKYDLIIMNPPFSHGSAHLCKALEMQENGGGIICILNAETLKNPFSNERKALLKKLEDLQADIQYYQGEFVTSEHPTGVEVAVVKVLIPEKAEESKIFDELKKKAYMENDYSSVTDLAPNDYVKAVVAQYELEAECGVRLIHEYKAMRSLLLSDTEILELSIKNESLSTNEYVSQVRKKYWEALFTNPKITGNMTSNLRQEYLSKVEELKDYDFSYYNIKCIQMEMCRRLVHGIEDCIISLFDELSFQYSFSDELASNIHYYNGWKTNKSWYINKKVIIPGINAYSNIYGSYNPTDYYLMQKLKDIEKALNYLDGGLTECLDMEEILSQAKKDGLTKKIPLKYFTVTFFKKKTCHIEFTNEKLLKKLNIFGSQQKGWLPQGYGKKSYQEFTPEEQSVIDSFEGEREYKKIVSNTRFYIYDPNSAIPMIDEKVEE